VKMTQDDAKTTLEAEGLHVSSNLRNSLWIAANVRDVGEGISVSDDACALMWGENKWVAVFPAEGLLTYEVPGDLPELVSLIASVYKHFRHTGGQFKDALKEVLANSEQYLIGRTLTRV
jgi:hypothetical protein